MRAVRTWALIASFAAHATLLLALLQWQEKGARETGIGGIEVALAPAGGAPGSVAAVDAAITETLDPVETAGPSEAVEVPPEEMPATEAAEAGAPREAGTVGPDPAPTLAPVPETDPEPVSPLIGSPASDGAAPVPPAIAADARPELAETPRAAPAETVEPPPVTASDAGDEPRTVAPEGADEPGVPEARMAEADPLAPRAAGPPAVPPPKPAPPRESLRTVEAPAPTEPAPVAQAPSAPGAAGRAGADSGGAGGGDPGSSADYFDLLRAWLERHKEYPRRAQMRRQEGTALLRFVMDRNGHVISYRIERSSGHNALDEAVEAMLEGARPLPTMPPEMTQARLELVIPVTFELR